jgi:hypothetical protein
MPSCQSEPERCSEQAGPEAEGSAMGTGASTGATGMGVRTAMGWTAMGWGIEAAALPLGLGESWGLADLRHGDRHG